MSVCLWHCTWPENVAGIVENGFDKSLSEFVHLSAAGDNWWRDLGRSSIIEMILDIEDDELTRLGYRSVSEDRQRFDPATNTHVEIEDPADYYRQLTYRIPVAFLNANMSHRRNVTPVS